MTGTARKLGSVGAIQVALEGNSGATKPQDINLGDLLAQIDPLDQFGGVYFPQCIHMRETC